MGRYALVKTFGKKKNTFYMTDGQETSMNITIH